MRRIVLVLTLLMIAACAPSETEQKPPLVGGDTDQHGCKASAGYRWCQSTGRCERPWELAAANGFANTAEGFDTFCKGN